MTETKCKLDLLAAFRVANVAEVQRLLPQLKNPAVVKNNCFKDGKTLLHYSCRHGWLDVTRRLVELYRCDPESTDRLDDTPLHEACRKGHVRIVRYLAGTGCSTQCENKMGDTPLHEACCEDRVGTVRYLVREQGCSTLI